MPINFPDAPSSGDTHTVGDKTWTYDGTAWNVVQNNIADHGNLGGLGDDDHTQYLLADGTRTATELYVSGDLTVDDFDPGQAVFHVDSTDNRVGIGTMSPSSPLHIRADSFDMLSLDRTDNANVDQQVILTPTYSGSGNTAFAIKIGGEIMRVTEAGNVGIGTTTPAHPLHVTGSDNRPIRAQSTVSGSYIDIQDSTTTGEGYVGIGAVGNLLHLIAGGTQRLTIDASGNVGIGTTSPAYALDVDGDINMRTGHSFYYDAAGATNPNPVFWIDGENTDIDIIRVGTDQFSTDSDYGVTLKYRGSGSGTSNAFDIEMDNQAGTQITAMSILQNGNVGIGTTTPAKKLHVKGDNEGIRIEDGGATDHYDIYRNDTTGYLEFIGSQTSFSGYDFEVNNGTNVMRINNSGNVGIGDTSPSYTLDVNGDINATGDLRIGGAAIGTWTTFTPTWSFSSGTITPSTTNGRYMIVNELVIIQAAFRLSSVSGTGDMILTIPAAASVDSSLQAFWSGGYGVVLDANTLIHYSVMPYYNGATEVRFRYHGGFLCTTTLPFTWAVNDEMFCTIIGKKA